MITALTNGVRGFMHIFTTVPKLCMSIYVTHMGLHWFSAAESFSALLFTFVAMEFILNIDELVFKYFFPDHTLEYISNTKLAILQSAKSEEEELSTLHHDYHISYLLLIFVAVFAFSYAHYLQQVIPSFEGDFSPQTCGRFYVTDGLCKPFQWNCFPYGPVSESPSPSAGPSPASGAFPSVHNPSVSALSQPPVTPVTPAHPSSVHSPSASPSVGGSRVPHFDSGLDPEALAHYGRQAAGISTR